MTTKRDDEETVRETAARIRREIEPEGDLWAGIARRIAPEAGRTARGADEVRTGAGTDVLAARTRALSRETAPVRDLWPSIRRRIEGREPVAAPARTSWIGWAGWAVAATAIVLAFQLPETLAPGGPSELAIGSKEASLTLPIQRVRDGRLAARARLHRVLAEDSTISPETRAIVRRNLETIDEALAEIQAAMAADPGNATLYRLLHATYRQEAEIVAQVTRRELAGGGTL